MKPLSFPLWVSIYENKLGNVATCSVNPNLCHRSCEEEKWLRIL